MRVAVTGGAGFIGANLVHLLCEQDWVHDVTVIDDLSTGSLANLVGADVRVLEDTILDRDALDRAFEGADAIVHLGARGSVPRSVDDPIASHLANTSGTAEVLEGARRNGVGHVVVASSSSVYGANPALPKHEGLVPMPASPYAATKLATEAYTLAWSGVYGFDALAFRFFNVFGPFQPAYHDYAAVVPAFVSAALEERSLPVHGDGTQTRDFTYVGTVCEVVADAVRRRVASAQPLNLAFGTRVSLLEVIRELEDILGRGLPIEHLPPRRGDVRDTQADTTSLRHLFPDVAPVPLRAGLEATVEWMRS